MRTSNRSPIDLLCLLLALTATPGGAAQPFVTYHESFYPPGLDGQEAWFARAADLDGDGRDELITGRWEIGADRTFVTIRRFGAGPWTPSFANSHDVGGGWVPGPCEAADVDGDGLIDVAVPMQDTLAVLPAIAPGTFGPPIFVPIPGIGVLAITDFDHDGIRDLAVTRYASDQVQIWRGTGSFGFAMIGSYATHNFPVEVAVADLDGNDDPDLVVPADTVSLALLGDGVGGFTPIDIAASRAQACGDLNGDGKEDLLAATSTLLGNGDGTFQPPLPYLPALQVAKTADLDEDGKLDLIGRRSMTPNSMVSVQRGFGNGQFGIPEYPAWWACQPPNMAIGDFDGDGHKDLALPGRNVEPDAVYYGYGNGQFPAPRQIPLTSPPLHVARGTLGGDAGPDLVVTSRAANSMSVLFSNGLGSWTPADTLTLPGTPAGRRIAIADIDGDGRDDILVGYSNLASISLWITQPNGFPGTRTDLVTPSVGTADLQSADVDHDQVPDILWVTTPGPGGTNPIHWFRGLGGGAFAAAQALPFGARWCFEAGDLNGDGVLDLAFPGFQVNASAVLVAIASSPGVFMPPVSYPWTSPDPISLPDRQIFRGDFDGDAHPDLALQNDRGLVRLHGLGGGAFAAPTGIGAEAAGGFSVYCAPGDLDGDGVDDLASGLHASHRIRVVRFGPGGGVVSNPILGISTGSTSPANLALADVDDNGTLDIVSALARRPWLDLLLNRTPPEVLGVRPPAVGTHGLALAPLAEPARDVLALRLSTTLEASVRVDLLDVQGRRLRSTIVRPSAGAATTVSFGRVTAIPSGVYYARARQGADTATAKLSVVR